MRLVQNDAEAKRIMDATFEACVTAPFVGLLVVDDNNVVHGCILLNNYERNLSIDFSFCGRVCPKTARELCRYVFNQLLVNRVTAVTRASNTAAQKALLRLGFHQEGRLRSRFHDEDGLIFGLLPSDVKLRF